MNKYAVTLGIVTCVLRRILMKKPVCFLALLLTVYCSLYSKRKGD
jgi:hypothetical protein